MEGQGCIADISLFVNVTYESVSSMY